jgi:hypothetical protein
VLLIGLSVNRAAVGRFEAGISLSENRSGDGVGAEGGATLQLQIKSEIVDPTEFVERIVLGNVDGLGDRVVD